MYIDQGSNNKCENCSTLTVEKYGSGRFCSAKCARSFSTKSKRLQINQKVSATMRGRPGNNLSLREAGLLGAAKNRQNKLKRFVKINGDTLDITYGELLEYRKTHLVCEICNRPEVFLKYLDKVPELAIDHCHKTMRFRGLLCRACNFRLGWFENQKENIFKYMGD